MPTRRSWLTSIDHGPWLGSMEEVRCAGSVCLMCLGVFLAGWLYGASHTGRVSALTANLLLAALVLGGLGTLLGACWWFGGMIRNRDEQRCPDCLQSMDRGAQVCPYCHVRERPAGAPGQTPRRMSPPPAS